MVPCAGFRPGRFGAILVSLSALEEVAAPGSLNACPGFAMIALVGLFGLGLLITTVFNEAVYALPLFVGASVGFAALHLGAGPLAGFAVGALAGWVTAGIAERLAASPRIGPPVALLFSGAAAIAGYQASSAAAHLGGTPSAWGPAMGVLGALLVGGTAWKRLRPTV